MTRAIAAIIGLASIVAALVFSAGMLLPHDVQATDGRTVTRTIQGHPHEWTLPEAGCNLLRAWEDHSATAWCPSGLYAYDPDGSKDRAEGVWYVANYSN